MKTRKTVMVLGVLCLVLAAFPLNAASTQSKPINMKWAWAAAPKGPFYTMLIVGFAELLKERSNGKLDFKVYPSGTLLKHKNGYKGIVNGVADGMWTFQVLTKGQFPLSEVMGLPFMHPTNGVGSAVIHDLYSEFPEIRAEYKNVHPLWFWTTMPTEIHMVKKPVRTLKDLKGMKIACIASTSPTLKSLGASPVVMSPGDMYQSLEKGVADGVAVAYGWFNNRRYYEVTKYHTNAHIGGTPIMAIMNKRRWESLSPDLQKIVTDVSSWARKANVTFALKEKAAGIQKAKETGEMIEISARDRERWIAAAARPAYDAWVEKMEGRGLPGRKVLDRALTLIKKYHSEKY